MASTSKMFPILLKIIALNSIFLLIWIRTTDIDRSTAKIIVEPPISLQIPFSVYSLSKSLSNDSSPSIPTRLKFSNLLFQNVRASRSFSSGSAIFFAKGQNDENQSDFWCLFADDLITPVYFSRSKTNDDEAEEMSLFECLLPETIRYSLWFNRTEDRRIRIAFSSSTEILLHSFLQVPWSNWNEDNEQSITLCTKSINFSSNSISQWIDFHRLIGITKFVIFSHENKSLTLEKLVESYDEDSPGLIDIVQWNSSFVGLTEDCFINYADVSEWIGFIDIDEFIVLPTQFKTLSKFLNEKSQRNSRISFQFDIEHFFSISSFETLNIRSQMNKNIFRHRISTKEKNKFLFRSRFISRFFTSKSNETIRLVKFHRQTIHSNDLDQFSVDFSIRNRFLFR